MVSKQEGTLELQIALRVLTSLTDKVAPAECDVAELRRLAPERSCDPIDEVACDVVQRLLKM